MTAARKREERGREEGRKARTAGQKERERDARARKNGGRNDEERKGGE